MSRSKKHRSATFTIRRNDKDITATYAAWLTGILRVLTDQQRGQVFQIVEELDRDMKVINPAPTQTITIPSITSMERFGKPGGNGNVR